jgi:hypothetical protein
MIESSHFATAAPRARVMAAALALGHRLDLWSLMLVTVALASVLALPLPLTPKIFLLISILAGGAQKIIALRVAFDARLFCDWTQCWTRATAQRPASPGPEADLAALDQVLATCGLRAPASGPLRDLDSRLRGAWQLLRQQVLIWAIQFVAVLAALVTAPLPLAG